MKAVIFDMNGVIIRDERFHQQSWRELCAVNPDTFKPPSEEEFKHNVFGRTEQATLEYLLGRPITQDELDYYSDIRVGIVKNLFGPHLALTEGLKELLEHLKEENVPLGIATSSRTNYVSFILDRLGIRGFFSTVATAENIPVGRGKPHPDIYEKTARELGVSPTSCIVFEDTVSGIKAGRDAGAIVIAVATTHEAAELTRFAHKVVPDFQGLTLDFLHRVHLEAEGKRGYLERR